MPLALGIESSSSSTYPCSHPSVQMAMHSLICLSIHPHSFILYPFHYSSIDPTFGFPGGSVVKNPPANEGDAGAAGLIPGLRRSPGVGNVNPLQYSSLENSMDRGACGAAVHGVTKSRTQLNTQSRIHTPKLYAEPTVYQAFSVILRHRSLHIISYLVT